MIILEYCAGGIPISDFQVERYYDWIVSQSSKNISWKFSTGPIFNRIRVGVAEGEIPHDQVVFVYEGDEIRLDQHGMIAGWPQGFLEIDMTFSERVMLAADRKSGRSFL